MYITIKYKVGKFTFVCGGNFRNIEEAKRYFGFKNEEIISVEVVK